MPMIYDYTCENCGSTIEAFVRDKDQEVPCDECGEVMKRQPPAVGLLKTNFQNKPSPKQR